QSATEAQAAAFARGAVTGTGTAMVSYAKAADVAAQKMASNILARADHIDAGDTSPKIYHGLSDLERSQVSAYLRADPAQRTAMRVDLNNKIGLPVPQMLSGEPEVQPTGLEAAGRAV